MLLLELVKEQLAPAEPHSFCDLAFARLLRLRQASPTAEAATLKAEVQRVVDDLTEVVTGLEVASRFREIEWPALILLSWAVAWADRNLSGRSAKGGSSAEPSLWPEAKLPADKYRVGGAKGPQLDVFVWLGWDTDHTDVDLHVCEPTGEEVYYGHNRSSSTGARVSRDFTDGYGPEVYTLPTAPTGKYGVATNYYASHQCSASTGSTSAVIWSITKMGRFEEEELQFSSVRLGQHKQRQTVLSIDVA